MTGYTALGTLNWDMDDVFEGAFCSENSGNTCTAVDYMSGVPYVGEVEGFFALTSAIKSTAPPTTVLGFSQGSLISSRWLAQNAGKPGAPDPEDLSFVLIANPARKYGGVRPKLGMEKKTPETEYKVLDIAAEYDGAADFPDNPFNLLAVANAFAGFTFIHIPGYTNLDLENSDKLVWTEGNTTYVLIRSENIPLLEPLRILGLDDLADRLNGPLKAYIDTAYNRDYPNLVDPESQDEVLQQFPAVYDTNAGEKAGTAGAGGVASLLAKLEARANANAKDTADVGETSENGSVEHTPAATTTAVGPTTGTGQTQVAGDNEDTQPGAEAGSAEGAESSTTPADPEKESAQAAGTDADEPATTSDNSATDAGTAPTAGATGTATSGSSDTDSSQKRGKHRRENTSPRHALARASSGADKTSSARTNTASHSGGSED
jgi:hypothetical protein